MAASCDVDSEMLLILCIIFVKVRYKHILIIPLFILSIMNIHSFVAQHVACELLSVADVGFFVLPFLVIWNLFNQATLA